MNAKTRMVLIVSFIVEILLLMLFSSILITGALSDAGMTETEKVIGNSWLWIPVVLTLGLIILIGWTAFSRNADK
jgi:ABC-type dipeptide/oligopeptide/nickel transport system permease component